MNRILTILAAILCLMQAAHTRAAQTPGTQDCDVTISIVNCYPGHDVYELEGHTALRVTGRIGDMPVDRVVNYGIFDFNSPNFIYRFVKGETDYMVLAEPWELFLSQYQRQGRRVVQHTLDLDSAQTSRLMYLLARNLEPENRVYRYNYVKDNCSLRPLRLIESAVGDSIVLPQPQGGAASDITFRDIMQRYHAHYPWYQFGIDLALGSGIDYPISTFEKAFAPVVLDSQLARATTGGRKLVSRTTVINEGTDATAPPTPLWHSPLAVGWLVFAVALVLTIADMRRRKVSRWFDTLYYSVAGITGCVLAFLIFISTHEATSPNWLFIWLNPLCLVVPVFIWLKKCKIVVFSYQIINFAAIFVMACCWSLTGQEANMAFIPLVLADALRAINYISITYPTIRHK